MYPGSEYPPTVRAPTQRRALGALFLILAAVFTGIAAAGANAGGLTGIVVAVTGGALALWMLGLVVRAWRG